MLTKKQKGVLDFIKNYQTKNEFSPSLENIRKGLKFASVSTAHFHIKKLKDLGYLQKEEEKKEFEFQKKAAEDIGLKAAKGEASAENKAWGAG